MTPWTQSPGAWLVLSLLLLGACTYLPLWIKDDARRSFVMRWVLMPVSVFIILYVYPVGIEVFRKFALQR